MKNCRFIPSFILILFSTGYLIQCNQNHSLDNQGSAPFVIELKYGQKLSLPGRNLSLEFNDVTMDSRCPEGVDCIWAGEGVVKLSINGEKEIQLETPKIKTFEIQGVDYKFTLIKLTPYPKAEHERKLEDYTAYIKIEPLIDEPLVQVKSDKKISMNSVL